MALSRLVTLESRSERGTRRLRGWARVAGLFVKGVEDRT